LSLICKILLILRERDPQKEQICKKLAISAKEGIEMKPQNTITPSKIPLDIQTDIFEKLRFNRSYPPLTNNTRLFYEMFIREKCLKEIEITGFNDIGKSHTVKIISIFKLVSFFLHNVCL